MGNMVLLNIYLKLCILNCKWFFFQLWEHDQSSKCFKNYTAFPSPLSNKAEQSFGAGDVGPARAYQAVRRSRMSLCVVTIPFGPSSRKMIPELRPVSTLIHHLPFLSPVVAGGIIRKSCSPYVLLGPLLHCGQQSRSWGVGTMPQPLSELPALKFWQLSPTGPRAGIS